MSRFALILLTVWAFFEASFWFIIPDFILLVLCMLNPKNYKKFFIFTILSSLIGITFYFLFVSNYPSISLNILMNTPFINQNMIDSINTLYNNEGIVSSLWQTTTFFPVKVWTYQAALHNFDLFLYLFFLAISRSIRMFIISFTFSFLGRKFNRFIRRNLLWMLIVYILVFFAILFQVT
jgi:membrane protein YqaA with SNARE-associated domain